MTLRNATVALALQSIELPPGRRFSHHCIFLTKDGIEGEVIETLDGHVRFTELEPGRYFATAASIADDGTTLAGPFQSDAIIVPHRVGEEPTLAADLINSLTLTLEPDMNDPKNTGSAAEAGAIDKDAKDRSKFNPDGRTGNPNDPVDMARHPDADVPIGGTLSNGEKQTADSLAAIQQAAQSAYSRQGNAAGHADQAEVAHDAATKKTDDGTATTGPSDS